MTVELKWSLRTIPSFSAFSFSVFSIYSRAVSRAVATRRKLALRKVRTPEGNAPHESGGRVTRETRTDSAAERYRRWPQGTGKGEMVE
jgi:hypothetical protein